jgi:nucleotide-binding universal stress UspA family protein
MRTTCVKLMKTILLPTDFSDHAANALRYAGALAAQQKSKLVLVHAIAPEYLTTPEGSAVAVPADPQQEIYFLNKLVAFGNQLRLETGHDFELEAVCVHGSLPDNLNRLVRSKQASLVVMGTHGAHHLPDTLIGTNTFHFIRQAECPVLVVPANAAFTQIKRVAYASDFETEDESPYLRQFLAFAQPFGPQLFIINIQSDEQLCVVPDQKVLQNIESQFPEHPFCIAQIREDDVVGALLDFVIDNQIDILAFGIQKRILLERIFHRSISRQLVFHSNSPLLALPGHPYQPPVTEKPEEYPLPQVLIP